MPSSINSTSSSPGGLISSGDTDNELEIKTGDTTAISIDASQNVTVAGDLTVSGTVSGTVDVDTVTGTLDVANGGTGATTLTANNVILGNGTSAVSFVAPGSNGNVLTSNGTTWTSAAPAPAPAADPTTAQVLNATAGASAGGVGTYAFLSGATINGQFTFGTTYAGSDLRPHGLGIPLTSTVTCVGCNQGAAPSGTWMSMGNTVNQNQSRYSGTVFLRVA